jgi:hypothetical protein
MCKFNWYEDDNVFKFLWQFMWNKLVDMGYGCHVWENGNVKFEDLFKLLMFKWCFMLRNWLEATCVRACVRACVCVCVCLMHNDSKES